MHTHMHIQTFIEFPSHFMMCVGCWSYFENRIYL